MKGLYFVTDRSSARPWQKGLSPFFLSRLLIVILSLPKGGGLMCDRVYRCKRQARQGHPECKT